MTSLMTAHSQASMNSRRHAQADKNPGADHGRMQRPRGLRTRRAILRNAVNIASVEGLEGLTMGRLASVLRISKSGLFAHFGSKEDLQCAVVEEAREIFVERVVRPAYQFQGLQRLRALCENWLAYGEHRVFPGGCFFSAASLEFDDRPGRVRDRIVELMKKWQASLGKRES